MRRGKIPRAFTLTGGLSKALSGLLRRRPLVAFAAFLLLSCVPPIVGQAPAVGQTPPPIRVRVDRVNVGVIVTDERQHLVEGLQRGDFELLDDGVPQPLTAFLTIDEPAQIVLMVECGPAVYFFRSDLVRAADTLLARLAPSDRVAIVCYTRAPELQLDFTADKNIARLALRELNFASGYGDLNLSASLSSVLNSLKQLPGKKTIVLVTSGVDTSPPVDAAALKRKLDASDVRILAVSTAEQLQAKPKHLKMSPQQKEDRSDVKKILAPAQASLRELAEITGGRVYTPKSSKDFDRAYEQIAELVRHEYLLEFAPPERDGKVHAIEVRVKRPFCHASHRQAYLAPSPG